ncbi:hypothetical protein D3C85_934710 [compost metagenome]
MHAEPAVQQRAVLASDGLRVIQRGLLARRKHLFADRPGATQALLIVGILLGHEDRKARELVLAASIDVLLLHRIVVDRHEEIGCRRGQRPLAQRHFGAVRRYARHAVAQGLEFVGHLRAQVQVVQVLHPSAGARCARPLRRVPGIDHDVGGMRRQQRAHAKQHAAHGPKKTTDE